MILEFNPRVNEVPLTQHMGWFNPIDLENQYIDRLRLMSGGVIDYNIVERQVIDGFPVKEDGFVYTIQQYLNCRNDNSTCHSPDIIDYPKLLRDYSVCQKLNNNQIDEVWLWGGGWFGYWEANTAGPGAFFTNGPIVANSSCNRILHIMGFNYERTYD